MAPVPENISFSKLILCANHFGFFSQTDKIGYDAITTRINELDREWDIERALEVNMSSVALTGIALTVFHSRRWLVLPAVVLGFFLQHAIQGWCPPLPVLRRLGFRTRKEIDQEKYALKVLRGDFKEPDRLSASSPDPSRLYNAIRK
jgi:hypothetical protein